LSEFLPYELPAGFSNVGLYAFLMRESAQVFGDNYIFRRNSPETRALLRILLGPKIQPQSIVFDGGSWTSVPLAAIRRKTVPFKFRIRHGEAGFRELAIPHPRSQIAFIDFYDRYKSLITHFGRVSPYSIRKPTEEVRITVTRDDLFELRSSEAGSEVEVSGLETSRLRSFFRYEDYSSLHGFFDSNTYREAEKSFGHLLRLDVSRCFESIYTHTIEWAIYGRANVKSNRSAFKGTFPNQFDNHVRAMNEDETHGILIGPEVSRIFAELLLQRIDRDIHDELSTLGLSQGEDYAAFRYVDDFFFFYNSSESRNVIQRTVAASLHVYKLHLQEAKIENVTTPYLTPLSMAKVELRAAAKRLLHAEARIPSEENAWAGIIATSRSSDLVDAYKTILAQTGVAPKDIANYALVQVEEALEAALRIYIASEAEVPDGVDRARFEAGLTHLIASAIEYAYFIYSGSGLASAGIKAARISALGLKASSLLAGSMDRREYIRQLVYSEVSLQMLRFPMSTNGSMEGLYLLDVLGELGPNYALPLKSLLAFLDCVDSDAKVEIPSWMHGVGALAILRYLRDLPQYKALQRALESWMLARVAELAREEDDHAERSLLALDMLTSPYVAKSTKIELLRIHEIANQAGLLSKISSVSPTWFTNWGPADLHVELLEKRSQHVY
jgi:hypothetical protein